MCLTCQSVSRSINQSINEASVRNGRATVRRRRGYVYVVCWWTGEGGEAREEKKWCSPPSQSPPVPPPPPPHPSPAPHPTPPPRRNNTKASREKLHPPPSLPTPQLRPSPPPFLLQPPTGTPGPGALQPNLHVRVGVASHNQTVVRGRGSPNQRCRQR